MSRKEIEEMLKETEIPYHYHHYEPEEAIAPPFLLFLIPKEKGIAADGKKYTNIKKLDIELYLDERDEEKEKAVERVLAAHGIRYTKTEEWISTEELYEVLYETEV